MVASVCDIGTSVRSRSRRISRDDVSKRAARSLSRAVATRQRSKSLVRDDDDEEENDPVYSKSSRRYTTESVSMFSRGGRSSRPERHRFEASDPSLFSKDDRTNSQDGSHGNHGMIKMGSKSRTHVVPPPPPRKIVDVNKSPPPEKMNSSLVSADSGQTESTHPSTSYNSSEPDMSLALVPYGNKQEKTLPLPPSPEPRRHSRRSSRGGDRLHRSHRDLAPRLEEESAIDISSRSESRLERRDRRSLGRSKSRSRRSAPRENVYESSYNKSNSSAVEDASISKSRTSRRSRDMNRINLREVQRSLSRNTRRKSTETDCKSTRSKSKGRQPSVATVSHSSRRTSMASTKSKSTRDVSHHNESSQSVTRCYKQIDAHPHGANTSTYDFREDHDRDDQRRSRSSLSTCSHKKSSPPAPPTRPSRSRSRPRSCHREDESHHDSTEGSDLLSNPVSNSNDGDDTPVLNLVIDDTTGCGSFTVPTLYASITGSVEKHLQLFTVQLNEPSREFFIQTSMGLLHKIREIHPKTNILRTLSYWNGLQKRRYQNTEGHHRGGGQLGISKADSQNKHEVIMTLVGKYHNRDWEYDADFHTELENFVEDALRFHACLNGLDENEVQEAQRKKKGLRLGHLGGSVTGGSQLSGTRFGNTSASGSHEDWMGKKVLCKVLEKITG